MPRRARNIRNAREGYEIALKSLVDARTTESEKALIEEGLRSLRLKLEKAAN